MHSRPQRLLHVIENLDRGAVETWLLRMLRHARERNIDLDWTFYCALGRPGSLDQDARALAAPVVSSPVPIGHKAAFVRALRAELQRGHYDVLHCHHDLVSAVYLFAGMGLPIRRRIVHVHNADESLPTPNPLKQVLLREPMRRFCLGLADRIVGISDHTLDTFLGGRSRRSGRDIVHYYGVDTARFRDVSGDRIALRRKFNLPHDALILLFGGRLVPEKDPLFVIEVLADLRSAEPRAFAVFAGTGDLADAVRAKASKYNVASAVRLVGWQSNMPDVMRCSDWFILPRPEKPMEGFGLAVVEAQLAGLRLLLSNGIANDPLLPTAVFRRLPRAAGSQAWANAAMDLFAMDPPSIQDAMSALDRSPMQMDRALAHLLSIHG
jgi:glycosyltransferase involved in cell wall biosynthesis